MAKKSLKDRGEDALESAEDHVPFFRHTVSMVKHYGNVNGSMLAGGVTYFGFLSFFPILALTFAVVGILASYYSGIEPSVKKAMNDVLPGLIGNGPGQIGIGTIAHAGAAVGIIGAISFLYTGLGWLSAMTQALQAVFEVPQREKRNFILTKAYDIVTLVAVGSTLLLSVAVTGLVTGFSRDILDWVGVSNSLPVQVVLWLLTVGLGLAASTVLFLIMFRLLGGPDLPNRALLGGALLSAIGFELLKLAASFLIANASSSPAAAVLGVSLVLLIWINYSSRIAMYGAAWAVTAARRSASVVQPDVGLLGVAPVATAPVGSGTVGVATGRTEHTADDTAPMPPRTAFVAGAVIGAVVAGIITSARDD